MQDLRKAADLDISDRIKLFYTATPVLQRAVEDFKEYIMTETLTRELVNEMPLEEMFTAEDAFDTEKVLIGIKKI